MESFTLNLVIIIISLVAIGLAVFFARSREKERREGARKLEERQTELASVKEEKAGLQARLDAFEAAQNEQQRIREEAQKELDRQRDEAFRLEREQMARALDEMKKEFKIISAEHSDRFKQQSAERIDELLKPVKEKFDKFDKSVQDAQIKSTQSNSSLEALIKTLMEQSKSVGEEARNLADALTGQSKVQGDFGEMLLTDLLRFSGLEEGINYSVQGVITDDRGHEIKSESGATMIPDVLVHYPDGGEVVVDSKMSLTDFARWAAAQTPQERQQAAKAHVASVRKHVDELAKKDYASYIPEGHRKIDYNLMFIPIEDAFRLMQAEEPLLWQEAKSRGVLIVSQMSLSIVLNMVLISWRQHDQQQNIEEVYATASDLMTQLSAWMDQYKRLGEAIRQASAAYDSTTQHLTTGKQNVIQKIDKLEKMHLKPKKAKEIKAGTRMVRGQVSIIPQELATGLDASDNEDEE
ncbi:MAG: DNA recombination protein RmuC [Bacteroidales bacterium]|nr:DNA recombination protein RmuC [Bacteroidales bacterium]